LAPTPRRRRWATGKDADLLRHCRTKLPTATQRAPHSARADADTVRRLLVLCGAVLWGALAAATGSAAEILMPQPSQSEPITISAQRAERWMQGQYEVWVLSGGCRAVQGSQTATSNEAVLWVERTGPQEVGPQRVIAYLEGQVRVEGGAGQQAIRLADENWWLGRLATVTALNIQVAEISGPPQTQPPIYRRGMARRMPEAAGAIRRTQYEFVAEPTLSPVTPPPPGTRNIRVHPRSNVPMDVTWEPDGAPNRWVAVINFGVNVIVEGVSKTGEIEVIDISADRVVIWTVGANELGDLSAGPTMAEDVPLEIYMEGNIVFRDGQKRVIYANRMYYDVRSKIGMMLGAELTTPVPSYQGRLRLQSEMIRQVNENQYYAQNSFLTSSRLGRPSYRIQVGDVFYEDRQQPLFDPLTQTQLIDPATGQPAVDHQKLATGRNSFLFLGEVPVFYWPTFTTDLEEASLYLRRIRLRNDNIFGTQILTDWNVYQLLGRKRPPGDDWDMSLDYLSERGLGHGTTYIYQRDGWWIFPGQTAGLADFWGIKDHGDDNLGRDQRDLVPEKGYRWRLFWQHRQMLPYDWRLSTEVGWISDRNFLEQYFEREWDELKDEATGVELKRRSDNVSYSITADSRLNGFFTQTEWYPRADHYWLGQPILGDALTWHEHSSIGYGRYRILSYPQNQAQRDMFRYMPWEISSKGERLVTTQEIDWPFQLGPVKAVPYALGQLAHWGEDLAGGDLQRAYYQAGIRTSLPMWRADPAVESTLWNVHGLAHKVVFDAEFSVAEANRDLDTLPLYDAMDDDSIEYFRRRMPAVTYGTQWWPGDPIPAQFDPRFYAVRTGLANWVTSPSAEVLDDMMAMRLGMRNRWQTKRGVPGRQRIIDWIVLDTNAVWFPKENRDNFGKSLGLVDYDFRWHVGDRLTLVSDGLFDFFDQGQQIVTIGGFLSRPPRGNVYMGLRFLQGPIDSHILSMAYNYWMSPKWVSSFGMSVDLGDEGNIGQRLSVTRIGEALLVSAGFNVDASRGSVGVNLAVEPRFLPKTRLGHEGGVDIPIAGAYGLE